MTLWMGWEMEHKGGVTSRRPWLGMPLSDSWNRRGPTTTRQPPFRLGKAVFSARQGGQFKRRVGWDSTVEVSTVEAMGGRPGVERRDRQGALEESRFLSQARVQDQSKSRIWWLSGQGPVETGARRWPSYLVAPQPLCYSGRSASRCGHAAALAEPVRHSPISRVECRRDNVELGTEIAACELVGDGFESGRRLLAEQSGRSQPCTKYTSCIYGRPSAGARLSSAASLRALIIRRVRGLLFGHIDRGDKTSTGPWTAIRVHVCTNTHPEAAEMTQATNAFRTELGSPTTVRRGH